MSDELSPLNPSPDPNADSPASDPSEEGEPALAAPRGDAPLPSSLEDEPEGGLGRLKVGLVFALLAGGVLFLLFGSDAGEAFVYSKLVHEVMRAPEEFRGRELRVEGDLRQGSVLFRDEPCEWRFVLQKEGEEMLVRFPHCVVPDTFRDDYGISVTVQGQLGADGVFEASDLIPRCPSKYEEQLQSGAEMPVHGPGGGPIAPPAAPM